MSKEGYVTGRLRFEFPINPVAKGRHRHYLARNMEKAYNPRKRRHEWREKYEIRNHSEKKTWKFEKAIHQLARYQMRGELYDGPLTVVVQFFLERPEKGKAGSKMEFPTYAKDLDNLLKSLFDGCNKAIWKDDRQIIQLTTRKLFCQAEEQGKILMLVEPYRENDLGVEF